MAKFNKGDYVTCAGSSGYIEGKCEYDVNAWWIKFDKGSNSGCKLWDVERNITLIRKANDENTLSAQELRDEAVKYPIHTTAHTALIALADKLDPPKPFKPNVKVQHSPVYNRVNVSFDSDAEREIGAKAISHFLYRAEHIVDEVYKDEPDKQAYVRAFVDAWHNRSK